MCVSRGMYRYRYRYRLYFHHQFLTFMHWPVGIASNHQLRIILDQIDGPLHASYPYISIAYVVERIGDVTHAVVARQAGAVCATGRCLPGGRRTPCSRPPTQAATGSPHVPSEHMVPGPLGMSCAIGSDPGHETHGTGSWKMHALIPPLLRAQAV